MTTPVRPLVAAHLIARTPGNSAVKLLMALGLLGGLLAPVDVSGQTSQTTRRVSSSANRFTTGNTMTLASYVSNYAGDGPSATKAPAAQGGSLPTPAPSQNQSSDAIQPSPELSYEPIGPGLPTDAIPGATLPGGGCDACGMPGDDYVGGTCWGAGSCYGGDCYPLLHPLHDRVWFRGEYLLWWLDGYSVPSLVPTSTNPADLGILTRSTTETLFGNQNLSGDSRSGGRFTLGWWLDPCKNASVEGAYTMIGESSERFESGLVTNSILARPIFDSGTGVDSAWLLAQPNQLHGWVNVGAKNEFYGLEVLLRRPLLQNCDHQMDVLAGYRYSALRDELSISDHRIRIGTGSLDPVGLQIDQSDWFKTDNTFHGFEFGFVNQVRYNRWSMELLTKLALGNTRSKITIDGLTTQTQGSTVSTTHAGLLTQATNIGTYQHDSFTVMPELGLTLGYDITSRLRCTFGYSLIYWSKVVRAGDQIDYNVNLPAVDGERPTGAQQPACDFKTTDFWAQGMNFGFEYNF